MPDRRGVSVRNPWWPGPIRGEDRLGQAVDAEFGEVRLDQVHAVSVMDAALRTRPELAQRRHQESAFGQDRNGTFERETHSRLPAGGLLAWETTPIKRSCACEIQVSGQSLT